MRVIIDIYNPHLLLHPPPDHWGVEDEDAWWNDTGEEVIEDVDEVGPERSPVSLSFPVIMTPAWSWCPWQPRSCCWECRRSIHRQGKWGDSHTRSWSRTGRGPHSSYGPSSCQFPGIIKLLRCVLFILNNTNLQCNVFICLCFEKWVEVDIAINSDGTIGYQQGLIYQPYFCKLYKIIP